VIAPRPAAPKRAVPEPEPPPVKSRRRTIVAAALVLLLLIAGIGLGYRIIRGYYYVGAHDDRVAIMRGIQGSVLGVPLQQPYQLGCINDRGELSQISYGQADTALGCELMRLQDLRPSERAQVSAGLPAGSLDDAIGQLRELAQGSLLPQCAPAPVTPPPSAAPRSGSGAPAAPPTSTSASPSAPASPTASPTTATTSGATPAPPAPTTTALPAPPQKPGVDCRAAA
jgi:protein phosphatase